MQAQIMQELDEEMKLHCEEDQPPDTTDVSKDDHLGENVLVQILSLSLI